MNYIINTLIIIIITRDTDPITIPRQQAEG